MQPDPKKHNWVIKNSKNKTSSLKESGLSSTSGLSMSWLKSLLSFLTKIIIFWACIILIPWIALELLQSAKEGTSVTSEKKHSDQIEYFSSLGSLMEKYWEVETIEWDFAKEIEESREQTRNIKRELWTSDWNKIVNYFQAFKQYKNLIDRDSLLSFERGSKKYNFQPSKELLELEIEIKKIPEYKGIKIQEYTDNYKKQVLTFWQKQIDEKWFNMAELDTVSLAKTANDMFHQAEIKDEQFYKLIWFN